MFTDSDVTFSTNAAPLKKDMILILIAPRKMKGLTVEDVMVYVSLDVAQVSCRCIILY
jgi:hypothetical protein